MCAVPLLEMMGASESQAKMLQQQDHQVASPEAPPSINLRISQKRCTDKDGNYNFLGPNDDDIMMMGDENRNQVRPRALGRDLSSNHYNTGPFSPLSRLPSWSPLEPLPEIESGDDMGGRVPPDGAEEGKVDEEMCRLTDDEKNEYEDSQKAEDLLDDEDDDEDDDVIDWGNSDDEDFEFSYKSESSSMDSAGAKTSIWEQVCVSESTEKRSKLKAAGRRESVEGMDGAGSSDSDCEPCTELPELMEAVWTLQDREKFKAQEMEKHQVQLSMYRRLALIRWLRTLQGRVQEQQNRLQNSFDIILTHRKELLRMGAANTAAAATAAQ
ncbi:uncharacterized protein LOC130246488 [Danio aesculapii]|uniref:uncharacterized protein LOC130246488 n=1 Tax=Danio aesculapii TaxID=1142201 RepID=UPI0024C014E7|nr:uncharacterized protein LOC130246488 [Danio aesculapii]